MILANKPWDTAAGVLIAREAGAEVLDADGAQHSFTASSTVAVCPGLAHELLTTIRTPP